MRRRLQRRPLRIVSARVETPSDDDGDQLSGSELSNSFRWSPRMYAIAFDLDQEMLDRHYPGNTKTCAYGDIERVFAKYGFQRQQGSVFFGDARVSSSVHCFLAVREVTEKHPWFRMAVKDIRMLR